MKNLKWAKKQKLTFGTVSATIITVLGIILFGILTIMTSLFTTNIKGYQAPSDIFLSFTPSVLIGIIVFILIIFIPPVRHFFKKLPLKYWFAIAFFVPLLVSLVWIFISAALPAFDSLSLVYSARHLNGTSDSFIASAWEEGGYMAMFPYQTPLSLILLLCMKISASNYILFFQVLNCFAYACSCFLLVKITHSWFKNSSTTILAALLCVLFMPPLIFCTFIYGDILALPFLLLGLLLQKHIMDNWGNTKSKRKLIFFFLVYILSCSIGILIKPALLILFIAYALIWVIWMLQRRQKILIKIVFSIAMIATLFIPTMLLSSINYFVQQHYHLPTSLLNGVPKITWIRMGIGSGKEQDADLLNDDKIRDSLYRPGCIDGILYSPDGIQTFYFQKRIEHFSKDPGLAIAFFTQKFLLEWTEPTFESLLNSNWDTPTVNGFNPNPIQRPLSRIGRSIYYGKLNKIVFYIMDVVQSILVIGVLLKLILGFKSSSIEIATLTPVVYALGAALLYIIWENKAQYILPVYVLMIPLATQGYLLLCRKVTVKIKKNYSRFYKSKHFRQKRHKSLPGV